MTRALLPALARCDRAAGCRLRYAGWLAGAGESGSTLRLPLGHQETDCSPAPARWCCRAACQTINAPLSLGRLASSAVVILTGDEQQERRLQVIDMPALSGFSDLSGSGPSHPHQLTSHMVYMDHTVTPSLSRHGVFTCLPACLLTIPVVLRKHGPPRLTSHSYSSLSIDRIVTTAADSCVDRPAASSCPPCTHVHCKYVVNPSPS